MSIQCYLQSACPWDAYLQSIPRPVRHGCAYSLPILRTLVAGADRRTGEM